MSWKLDIEQQIIDLDRRVSELESGGKGDDKRTEKTPKKNKKTPMEKEKKTKQTQEKAQVMRVTEYFAYINRMVDNDKLFSHLTVTEAIKKDRKKLDKLKRKARRK